MTQQEGRGKGIGEVWKEQAGRISLLLTQIYQQGVLIAENFSSLLIFKMAFVAVLVGLTLAQLAASQARYNLGNFEFAGQRTPVIVEGLNQHGVAAGFQIPGSIRTGESGSDGSFFGSQQFIQRGQSGRQVIGRIPGAVPLTTSDQSGPGFLPDVDVSGNALPGANPLSGQSGVITAPSQQGPSFIGGGSIVNQVGVGQFQGEILQSDVQNAGFFSTSVVTQPVTPTVTQTSTVDAFETLTDLVLHSVPVTQTFFTLLTTTQQTKVVVPTPVDDFITLSTTVVARPTFVTITETKSDFRLVVRTSVSYATLTHTAYSIINVPYTIRDTQTVPVTSTMIRTVINTFVSTVTDVRTIAHTVLVHGGYA